MSENRNKKFVLPDLPEFGKKSFRCPHCQEIANQTWSKASTDDHPHIIIHPFDQHLNDRFPLQERTQARKDKDRSVCCAECSNCNRISVWLAKCVIDKDYTYFAQKTLQVFMFKEDISDTQEQMIYPDNVADPLPKEGVPEDVRKCYHEATTIVSRSPRAATALLRLAIESLCNEISPEAKKAPKLYLKIQAIVNQFSFSKDIESILDVFRLSGNDAVHKAGEIYVTDVRTPEALFWLLRYIVNIVITQPMEAERQVAELQERSKNLPDSLKLDDENNKAKADSQTDGT